MQDESAGQDYFLTRDHLEVSARLLPDRNKTTRYDYTLWGNGPLRIWSGSSMWILIHRTLAAYTPKIICQTNWCWRHIVPMIHAGRWLSWDPIAEEGGLNLYEYSNNAPSLDQDPLGLKASLILVNPNSACGDAAIYNTALTYLQGPNEIAVASYANPTGIVGPDGLFIDAYTLGAMITSIPGYTDQKNHKVFRCHVGGYVDSYFWVARDRNKGPVCATNVSSVP